MLDPWTEVVLVLLLAAAGAGTAWCTRWVSGRAWLGVALPAVGLVMVLTLGRRHGAGRLPAEMLLLLASPRVPILLAVLLPLALLTPGLRLPRRRDRRAVGVVLAAAVLLHCMGPPLSAGWVAGRLGELPTKWGPDGVCRQGTDFTCGPAAAVTALRCLGLDAGEGEIALGARTSPASGTPPEVLARVLSERYAERGLAVELAAGEAVRRRLGRVPVLVVVRYGLLLDHWWCVLEAGDGGWWVADPLTGREWVPAAELDRRWRGVGIVLRRPDWHGFAKIGPGFPKPGRAVPCRSGQDRGAAEANHDELEPSQNGPDLDGVHPSGAGTGGAARGGQGRIHRGRDAVEARSRPQGDDRIGTP